MLKKPFHADAITTTDSQLDDEYYCFKENQPCEKGKGILASQLYVFIEEDESLFTTNSEVINQNNIN